MKSALSLFHKLNKRYKFDLVHFNEPHIILQKLKLPTVCTVHSTQVNEIELKLGSAATRRTLVDIQDLVLKGTIGSIFDIFTARTVDRIICPSSGLKALVLSYCFGDENRTQVIPNGIDIEAFSSAKREDVDSCLKEYGLDGSNYVLYVGRLGVLKGVQYAIQAFKSISGKYPNLSMAIVGKGDFEASLRNLAGGAKNIVFTGYVDSLNVRKTLYEHSLFVVVPSLYEVSPMVVLEAMACGKAIVASNVGGIPLLVRSGRNGFLTKPGDPEDIAKFMSLLLKDQKLREDMGSLSRDLAENEFSVEQMVNRTLKVYESLDSMGGQ